MGRKPTSEAPFESSPRATVLQTIGGTPLVQLRKLPAEGSAEVYVKLEYYNPTGSYKDRMALAMVEGAESRGLLRPGSLVVEFTGGSTGSSLALVCAVKGYRFKVVSSDAFSEEKLNTMLAFGADLVVIPSAGGQITPDLFDRMREKVLEIERTEGAYWTRQFENRDALDGYAAIGAELLEQLDGEVDVFCGAVGTAGMLVGVRRALQEAGSKARVIALEPSTSPILTQGHGGAHRVEGIGAGFVPPHLKPDTFDEARAIDEVDARTTARRLAAEEGIFAGTSSGLNVLAALEIAAELGKGHRVATVACDTGLKYLAGDLYRASGDEP